ncbi:MAG: phosphotransferase family protein [Ktedonobacterales bacterium]
MQDGWARRERHLTLDAAALGVLLAPALPGAVVAEAEPLTGGLANTNYKVTLVGRRQPVVVRVYTREVAACAKETALARLVEASVPVPRVLYADCAGATGGRPYQVMEWVDGTKLEQIIATGDRDALASAAYALGETLVALSGYPFAQAGFFDAGLAIVEPMDTLPVAVTQYVTASLHDPRVRGRLGAALAAGVEAVVARRAALLEAVPARASLVHGDYKPQNLLLRRDAGGRWRTAAVLDWEFAFVGTPLFDLGQLLRYRATLPPEYRDGVAAGYAAAGGELPAEWPRITRLLDLVNLCGFLARPEANRPMIAEVRALVERTVAELA